MNITEGYETVAVAAVSQVGSLFLSKVTRALMQPRYIIAPATEDGAIYQVKIYQVEEAPAWAFDAWCSAACSGDILYDFTQAARTLRINRSRWTAAERWQVIEELATALQKIGATLPLYSRAEARRTLLIAMEGV